MLEKDKLASDLRKLQDNNYELAGGESMSQYTDIMLTHIGDSDPDLRDELIYSTFSHWIYKKRYYSAEELRRIMTVVLDDNHLFYRLGQDGDQTVFTRSFSVLLAALILNRHRSENLFTNETFVHVKDALIKYYQGERDLRGFVEEYGWAHAAAHGADALDELVQCPECTEAACIEILKAIGKVLCNEKYFLYYEEDERIATTINTMISGNTITASGILEWLDELCLDIENGVIGNPIIARVNSKNFIRCLYFRLVHSNIYPDLPARLLKYEMRLNKFIG